MSIRSDNLQQEYSVQCSSFLLSKASIPAKNVFHLCLDLIFQKRTLTLLVLLGCKETLLDNA